MNIFMIIWNTSFSFQDIVSFFFYSLVMQTTSFDTIWLSIQHLQSHNVMNYGELKEFSTEENWD